MKWRFSNQRGHIKAQRNVNNLLESIFHNSLFYMGIAIGINPGYLKLRKIRAAQSIARTVKLFLLLLFEKYIKLI